MGQNPPTAVKTSQNLLPLGLANPNPRQLNIKTPRQLPRRLLPQTNQSAAPTKPVDSHKQRTRPVPFLTSPTGAAAASAKSAVGPPPAAAPPPPGRTPPVDRAPRRSRARLVPTRVLTDGARGPRCLRRRGLSAAGGAMERRRRPPPPGRPVSLVDWDRQSRLLAEWNDGG